MNTALVWIRRDLRLDDHPALAAATLAFDKVYIAFNFDSKILTPLSKLTDRDKRVHFLAESLAEINTTLQQYNASILLTYGDPKQEIPKLVKETGVSALFFNTDYESYPNDRDDQIVNSCEQLGVEVHQFKDHLIFEPNEILKDNNDPFFVFTPYYKKWRTKLDASGAPKIHTPDLGKVGNWPNHNCPSTVEDILKVAGFLPDAPTLPGGSIAAKDRLSFFLNRVDAYKVSRDFPAQDNTSLLSVYTRHGCISTRELVRRALEIGNAGAEKWLSELAWREFYYMIATHFPHVNNRAFQAKYANLDYRNAPDHIQAWKDGRTGFPIVDAAMRCLNETGLMHNRLRMLCASVLCKTLLVDWRIGEAYFALKLLDFDFACNNGGWQWTAGVGVDAAPYFRIFNPFTQSLKFDTQGEYIRQWVPELAHLDNKSIHNPYEKHPSRTDLSYPKLIVDYKKSREDALALYKVGE